MGDKRRQVGNKCKIMQAEHPETGERQAETGGDTCKIMWAEHPERTGGQVGDKRRQVGDKSCGQRKAETSGRYM